MTIVNDTAKNTEKYTLSERISDKNTFDWDGYIAGEHTYMGTVRVNHETKTVEVIVADGVPERGVNGLRNRGQLALDQPSEANPWTSYGITLREIDKRYLLGVQRALRCDDPFCKDTIHVEMDDVKPIHVHSDHSTREATIEVCRHGSEKKWRVNVDVTEDLAPTKAARLATRIADASKIALMLNRELS